MNTVPELATLQTFKGGKYRCSNASKLRDKDKFSSPDCMFQLIWKGTEDGVDTYAIRNIENNEYFTDSITHMSRTADSKDKHWRIQKVPNQAPNIYTIQNAAKGSEGKYMTDSAGSLHKGTPGEAEYWIITTRVPDASTSSWMTKNWDLIGNQPLNRICLPGSHDSGTFEEQEETSFGSVRNTRTQLFDIGLQLMQGVRVFDLRPVIYNGNFYTAHYSKLDQPLGYQGAIGVSLDTAFDQIAAFAAKDENSKELIILNFPSFINWDRRNSDPNHDKDAFITFVQYYLSALLVRGASEALHTGTLNQLIHPIGDSRKNVIAVFSIDSFSGLEEKTEQGLWTSPNHYSTTGGYSNTDKLDYMKETQLSKMQIASHADTKLIFELCWQLTLSDEQSAAGLTSILDLAKRANPDLPKTVREWIHPAGPGKDPKITSKCCPNVINTDACEESVTEAVQLSISICRLIQGL